MASRPIREVQALNIVTQELPNDIGVEKLHYAAIETLDDFERIENAEPWVLQQVRIFNTIHTSFCCHELNYILKHFTIA